MLDEARRMAAELGLPPNWLSEGVVTTKHGLADDCDPIDWTELSPGTSVRVRIGSPRFLLAMKAMTSRRATVDLEDAAFLANLLALSHEQQIAEVVTEYWGDADVGSHGLFFEDIAERARQLSAPGDPAAPSLLTAGVATGCRWHDEAARFPQTTHDSIAEWRSSASCRAQPAGRRARLSCSAA